MFLNIQKKFKKGFTLIELLIVIAVIAIIATVVFVALNPLERFRDSRNSQRWQDIESIVDAVRLYQIDNDGQIPSGIDENWRMLGIDSSGCDVSCVSTSTEESITSETFSARVLSSTDDAEERNPPNGYVSRASTDLELVNDDTTEQIVGMRFQSVTIPAGVTIDSAYISFVVDEADSGATSLIFYGQDIDDAPNFADTYGDLSNRTKTTSNVSWNNIPAWDTIGETKSTPNLSSIIQEIIDRSGWSSGNDIVFLVEGTGERTAAAYDGSNGDAPLLTINYSVSGGGESSSGISLEPACLDLSSDLSSKLSIPHDPSTGNENKTYYAIRRRDSGIIDVVSCSAEGGELIGVSR